MVVEAMQAAQVNKRYRATVIGVIFVLFFLAVMWERNIVEIAQFVLKDLALIREKFYGFVPKTFLVLTIYIVFRMLSYVLVDLLMLRLHKYYDKERDFTMRRKMAKFIIWLVFIFFVLFVLFEEQFGTIITSLGLVGFGITFALQKPILNFVGWMTISIKGIYKVGDRIKIGQVRGDVLDISMMNTTVESLMESADMRSGKIVTIPNELVLTGDAENYTKTSNYVLVELPIAVTYESNLKKAERILHDIASRVTRENKKILKTALKEEQASIEQTLVQLGQQVMTAHWGRKRIKQRMEQLAKEETQLKGQEDVLEEEFQPRIRVELRDSSVALLCYFQSPYDQIKLNKSVINKAFLEAIAKEPDIEIAYPHTELVFNKTVEKLKR